MLRQMGPLAVPKGDEPTPVGELFLWPSSIEVNGSNEVTAWRNLGSAGASLDMLASTGTVIGSADGAVFDGTCKLATAGNATALNLADGDDFDVVVVFSLDMVGLRAVLGGDGGAHWRVAPRGGGGSQWVLIGDSAQVMLELGPNYTTPTSVQCFRGILTGAASPANDVASIRAQDTSYDPGDSEDMGPVTFTNPLAMGIVTGSSFDGTVHAAAAKVGGFSAPELASLTADINSRFGLGLTSV